MKVLVEVFETRGDQKRIFYERFNVIKLEFENEINWRYKQQARSPELIENVKIIEVDGKIIIPIKITQKEDHKRAGIFEYGGNFYRIDFPKWINLRLKEN